MKKEIDFSVKLEGTIEIDVPDHLVELLENSYRLPQYIFPSEEDDLRDLKEELFDLIDDSISFDSCYFDEIYIDNVTDIEE